MVCLYLYFELRAGGQQYTPTYFLVTRSSAFCISNPILDQLTGGTSQMGGFFCTFYCWLAACFLKSALWIINRLHKHQRKVQFYRKAGGVILLQWNIPTSRIITKIDRTIVRPPIRNLHKGYCHDWDVMQHSDMKFKCKWKNILWNFGKHLPCDYIWYALMRSLASTPCCF